MASSVAGRELFLVLAMGQFDAEAKITVTFWHERVIPIARSHGCWV